MDRHHITCVCEHLPCDGVLLEGLMPARVTIISGVPVNHITFETIDHLAGAIIDHPASIHTWHGSEDVDPTAGPVGGDRVANEDDRGAGVDG